MLGMRKMQINITVGYLYVPFEWLRLKRFKNPVLAGKRGKQMEPSCTAGGDMKWYNRLGKSMAVSYGIKHSLSLKPSHSTPRYLLKRNEKKKSILIKICTYIFLTDLFILAQDLRYPNYPSIGM